METYEEICGRCNGSGEGSADGTRCPSCKGDGVQVFDEEGALLADRDDREFDDDPLETYPEDDQWN